VGGKDGNIEFVFCANTANEIVKLLKINDKNKNKVTLYKINILFLKYIWY
jgi:diphthamide synthase (EF-2-diphthine--ammonia ligase)